MSARVDILQVITDTDRRGAQVQALDLQRVLSSSVHSVRTVALAPGRSNQGLDVPALGRSRLGPGTLLALRLAMRTASVTVAFGSSTLYAGVVAGVGTRGPLVYRNIGDLSYWADKAARRARVRFALARADAAVALWSGSAETLARRFGIDASAVHVIPNAVDASRFAPTPPEQRAAVRAGLGVRDVTPTLLYLGSLAAEKNIDLAIAAMAHLQDCQLLVVGDGPKEQRLQQLAGRVAPGRVHFLGTLPAERALATADAVVLPSRSEGLPGVLIEAAFCALPTIVTSVGGVHEIVQHGRTGVVVSRDCSAKQFASAVRQALLEAEVYGAAARQRCLERFEAAVVAAQWLELYERLTGTD